jgi:pantoate--beta-alanine ligase
MKIIKSARDTHKEIQSLKKENKSIGFVPTMGALHDGHLSLVSQSLQENDITVVSIFVNPLQFGENEDLDNYPRPFDSDRQLLENPGIDILFYPPVEEMYPPDNLTRVIIKKLPDYLCGAKRPGHFEGVATVVTKLFNIVTPDRAYFGQKDYQQSVIIKRIVKDLNMYIDIRVLPTMREKNGLAMSSRNKYLSEKERTDAGLIYKSLVSAKRQIEQGERSPSVIVSNIERLISEKAPYAKIDYISVAHPDSLEELKVIEKRAVIAVAVFFNKARLIDNILIEI